MFGIGDMGLLSDTINKRTDLSQFEGTERERQPEFEQLKPMQPAPQAPIGKNGASFSASYDPKAYQKNWTVYDIIANAGKPYDYEAEVRKAERAKKMGMLTDIFGLAGNLVSGIAGRRIYNQAPQATSIAEARLQRLKDLQRAGEIQYQNALQNARLQDYQIARQDARHKAALEAEANKLRADMAYKQAEFSRKVAKDKSDAYWNAQLEAGRNARSKSELEARSRESALNRSNSKEIAKIRSGGSEKFDYLLGEDGKFTTFPKDKSKSVISNIYRRMQRLVEANPEKYGDISDMKLRIGVDRMSEIEAIVRSRIQDFPELQEELDYIIANSESNSGVLPQNMDNIIKNGRVNEKDKPEIVDYIPTHNSPQKDTIDYAPSKATTPYSQTSTPINEVPKYSSFEKLMTDINDKKKKELERADSLLSKSSLYPQTYYPVSESINPK